MGIKSTNAVYAIAIESIVMWVFLTKQYRILYIYMYTHKD